MCNCIIYIKENQCLAGMNLPADLGRITQVVECSAHNGIVDGSIPSTSIISYDISFKNETYKNQ